MSMRSCYSSSYLSGISRAVWKHAVAGTLSLTGGSHQHIMCYLPLRLPVPPTALSLAERFFSSSSSKSSTKRSAAKKGTLMEYTRNDPFYVIRKGKVGNSVCDPSVTVYKGYSLRKSTEEYHAACGLKNALYCINAADASELFDDLAPCQHPDGIANSTLKRPQEMETGPSKKHPKVAEQKPLPDSHLSCILEFDGSSQGNPGRSGAGVIVRRPDGSVIAKLREGLGIATYNVSEYQALLLGLRYAAKKGFKYVRAQSDCELVCMQVEDLWRTKRDNMVQLYKKVKKMKGKFLQFHVNHVLKEVNAAADAQAKLAVKLPESIIHCEEVGA